MQCSAGVTARWLSFSKKTNGDIADARLPRLAAGQWVRDM
jgi:hypothetical protein